MQSVEILKSVQIKLDYIYFPLTIKLRNIHTVVLIKKYGAHTLSKLKNNTNLLTEDHTRNEQSILFTIKLMSLKRIFLISQSVFTHR